MGRLNGKVAIVTGGASGIGLACARRFLAEGAKVVIADKNESAGEAALEDLVGEEQDVRFQHCDVAERLDALNLLAATIDAFERVDVLVNNAGIIDDADFLKLEIETFDQVLGVNLRGAFLVGQTVAKQMVDQVKAGEAPGSIINISSINSVFALPDHVAYSVSKGGLRQLTNAMALSLAPYGIRVNAIGPGSIATDMLKTVAEDEEALAKVMTRTPLGRLGRPREIAAVAAFLAGDDSSYVTGTTVFADGGRLPLNYFAKTLDEGE